MTHAAQQVRRPPWRCQDRPGLFSDDDPGRTQESGGFFRPYSDVPLHFIAAEGAFQGYSPEELAGKTIIVLRNSPRPVYGNHLR
ncbi:hypothetical protein RAH32_15835 [Paracoccus sp. WLY502]|uniref:hypothetical protein n=1 Tax=Paracoccus yibinensis TaxID=3068891 RepID=UPI002796772E|nr:hypothetical protein [Paracoccus sp. WLY502]MDQ1901912.1 hypothetical protein [Paracoccus sp. WLY502]